MITDFGLARTVDDASLTRTGVIAGRRSTCRRNKRMVRSRIIEAIKQLVVAAALMGLAILIGTTATFSPLTFNRPATESHPQTVPDQLGIGDEIAEAGRTSAMPVMDPFDESEFTATIDSLNSRLDALSELETLSPPQLGDH